MFTINLRWFPVYRLPFYNNDRNSMISVWHGKGRR